MKKPEWEKVSAFLEDDNNTKVDLTFYRLRVPGGWLVMTVGDSCTMIFVPDPEHKWLLDDEASTTPTPTPVSRPRLPATEFARRLEGDGLVPSDQRKTAQPRPPERESRTMTPSTPAPGRTSATVITRGDRQPT